MIGFVVRVTHIRQIKFIVFERYFILKGPSQILCDLCLRTKKIKIKKKDFEKLCSVLLGAVLATG